MRRLFDKHKQNLSRVLGPGADTAIVIDDEVKKKIAANGKRVGA